MASMMMINIAGLVPVDDPFYRYKMPSVICTYEKRWTVLVGLKKIADALHRPRDELLKAIGLELCTQTSVRDGKACVKGHFTEELIQSKVRNYIEGFVLCSKCQKPETAYRIKLKRGIVSQKCYGCGVKTPLCMQHKVSSYIVTQFKAGLKEKNNGHKGPTRRGLMETEASRGMPSSTSKTESSQCLQPRKKKASVKAEKTKATRLKDQDSSSKATDALDDDEALEEATKETINYLRTNASSLDYKGMLRVVKQEQKASVLLGRERIRILFRAAITMWAEDTIVGGDGGLKLLQLPDPVYAAASELVRESELMRHYIEDYTIECIGEAVCLRKALKPIHFVLLLKACYEHDVLEEEAIIRWWTKESPPSPSPPNIRNDNNGHTHRIISESDKMRLVRAAKPFIRWLEEAETESDSDSCSDE